ncbi:MAG: hypothetical protein H6816_07320 [Phycisphaerales bacterium]|nr:hypothetical protein [Phycisphaerales bacterium]
MKTATYIISLAALCSLASLTTASPPDEYVSGLLHQPLGGISSFSVTDRRLTACCIGSSGEDGVEVRLASVAGGGASIDITQLLGATGLQREIRIRPKGWDGTVKGNLRISSDPDGHITEEYDFSTIGVTALEWRVRDGFGNVLDHGTVAGAVLSWGLDIPDTGVACNKLYSFAPPATAARSAEQGFFDRVVSVTGLTPDPIAGVQSIEVTPVQPCAGCPGGPPWDDVQSIEVTADGISELVVDDAHLRTFGVESWALGQAHLAEECIGVPPPCAATERGLVVDNLGSSGEDGVAIDLGPDAHDSSVARGRCKDCPPGHVIIMKLYDDEGQEAGRFTDTTNPGTGQGVLTPDFSALGSVEFDAAYIGSDGAVLAVERCANGTALDVPAASSACTGGNNDNWRFGGNAAVTELHFCEPSGALVLPSGTGVSGAVALKLQPLGGSLPVVHIGRIEFASLSGGTISVDDVHITRAAYASGLPHVALGGVSNLSVDGRRLSACCLGSSGEDGVEVLFDSLYGGGASVDVAPLLGATGVQREIRVRPKGWDGTVKGVMRVIGDPGGNLSEEYDFSTIGATSLDWRLLNAHGGVLAEGTVAGPVMTWGLDVAGAPATLDKLFAVSTSATGARSANEGFFDRVVTVSGLTPDPVAGVQMIEVTPVEPCAGCPNGPPWDDLRALDLAGDGVPDLVVSNAHLRTFGVECFGVGQARISEQCGDPLAGCEAAGRRLAVSNLGSSGDDGVGIDLGTGASGATVAREKKCKDCPPGHVIIMKLYDDEGGETFRVTHTEDPLSGNTGLQVDAAGQGASQTHVTFLDDGGSVLGSVVLDAATVLEYLPDTPNAPDIWSWVGGRYVLRAGVPVRFDASTGESFINVDAAVFEPISPAASRASTRAQITGDDPSGFIVDSVVPSAVVVGDIDRDGDLDLVDFGLMAQCVLGPGAATAPPACSSVHFLLSDLDRDADVDLGDYARFQRELAGE